MDIIGKIDHIVFYNKENSFAIMKITIDGEKECTAIKGVFPDMALIGSVKKATGITVAISGKKYKNTKYGDGIDATSIVIKQTGLMFFLSNVVKGLNFTIAKQLIDHYGENELSDIIENNPNVLMEFKGIKKKKLEKITKSWADYKNLKNVTEFFADQHVFLTSLFLFKIYNHFKNLSLDPITAIKENPFCLTDIRGVGFKTADSLALKLGTNRYGAQRAKALIDFILMSEASDNGHTFLYKTDLKSKAIDFSNENDDTKRVIESVDIVLNNKGYDDYYQDDEDIIALSRYKFQEDYLENYFRTKSSQTGLYNINKDETKEFIIKKEKELNIKFSDNQAKAISAVAGGISVFALCGYAGAGKTTISKVILDFYKEFINEEEIMTCAFTGMASKRIADLTGYEASTIHSLLGFDNRTGKFKHNKNNTLSYKVVLVDESSMINLRLFYSLIRALRDDAILILVGDDAQLPPIGEGNVFADVLKKEYMHSVKLNKIYRQDERSVLTYFASFIRQGKMPPDIAGAYNDFKYINKDISNYNSLKKSLSESELRDLRSSFNKSLQTELLNEINLLDTSGLNKIWNVQVITPMKATDVGTASLNVILQENLNHVYKQDVSIKNCLLKQYDKVIHLKNQNMITLTESKYSEYKKNGDNLNDMANKITQEKERIYNGSIGLVLDIDKTNEMFSVVYPEPKNKIVVIYSFSDYKNIIDLGYALTIHKTQGGQFDYVFMPVINGFYVMLNNKLFYTAITRAKKKVIIIGQFNAIKRASTNIYSSIRNTFLSINYNENEGV